MDFRTWSTFLNTSLLNTQHSRSRRKGKAQVARTRDATGAANATKKCNQGDADGKSLTDQTCNSETTCTSPMFVEYTGRSAQVYGCGACDTDAKDKTCMECDATTTACNAKYSAPEGTHTFECFTYTYDAAKKKFEADKTATTCHALKSTAVKCNRPGDEAGKAYTQVNDGCGPCEPNALNDKTCKECNKSRCSSATTLTFILAPLLAVIFHMM